MTPFDVLPFEGGRERTKLPCPAGLGTSATTTSNRIYSTLDINPGWTLYSYCISGWSMISFNFLI